MCKKVCFQLPRLAPEPYGMAPEAREDALASSSQFSFGPFVDPSFHATCHCTGSHKIEVKSPSFFLRENTQGRHGLCNTKRIGLVHYDIHDMWPTALVLTIFRRLPIVMSLVELFEGLEGQA